MGETRAAVWGLIKAVVGFLSVLAWMFMGLLGLAVEMAEGFHNWPSLLFLWVVPAGMFLAGRLYEEDFCG